MQTKLIVAVMLFSQVSLAQNALTPIQELKSVVNIKQAEVFVKKNTKNNAIIRTLNANASLSAFDRKILQKTNEGVFTIGNEVYKIIQDSTSTPERFQYIFLDGNLITKSEIDAIRIEITKQYKYGESIESLYNKYNMDTRNTIGDLGWANYDNIDIELRKAISKHKGEEIFAIDLPKYNWHYVVKSNAKNKSTRKITYIKVKK